LIDRYLEHVLPQKRAAAISENGVLAEGLTPRWLPARVFEVLLRRPGA
jgi:hypothetical protein